MPKIRYFTYQGTRYKIKIKRYTYNGRAVDADYYPSLTKKWTPIKNFGILKNIAKKFPQKRKK